MRLLTPLFLLCLYCALVGCTPGAGGTRYYAKLQVWGEEGTEAKPIAAVSNMQVDVCFKVDEKNEPICYKKVGSDALLRITTKSQRLALYSVTLLGEKPYGDKNYYYAWQPNQLIWLSLGKPVDHVYVGTLILGFGQRKGEEYPSLGVAAYCSENLLKALEAKEGKPVLKKCFNIGSVELSDTKESHTIMRTMPPKPMYRPFGRDPDVPFGEIPPDAPRYHD